MRNPILMTAAIAVVAGGIALALSQSDKVNQLVSAPETTTATETTTDAATATETAAATDQAGSNMTPVDLETMHAPAAGEEAEAKTDAVKADEQAEEKVTAPASGDVKIDVKAALEDRSIGSENAKVVVEDFSSLTCPHCAFFHNEIFPKIKENYIDTGKVRWVFRGFPLNEPALKAEMIARCAPKDQYEKLIGMMFRDQAKWAFIENPMPTLSIMVRVAGITDELFVACINNLELETGLVEKTDKASTKYNINSTPTFVMNDGEKVFSGAGSYTGFAYDLDQLLNQDPAKKPVRPTTENKDDFMPPAAADENKQ